MKLADLLAQLDSVVAELRAAEAPLPGAVDALEAKVTAARKQRRAAVLVSWSTLRFTQRLPLFSALDESTAFYDKYEVN